MEAIKDDETEFTKNEHPVMQRSNWKADATKEQSNCYLTSKASVSVEKGAKLTNQRMMNVKIGRIRNQNLRRQIQNMEIITTINLRTEALPSMG